MSRKVATFAIAHTDLTAQPFNNAQRTVRILVPNNLNGNGIYIKFSNYYSSRPVWIQNASLALSDKGVLRAETLRPITVNGDTSFAIVPQRDVYSDFIPMTVEAGQVFAVSLYYPLEDKVTSGNFVGNFAQRSIKGDYCDSINMPEAKLWTKISHSLMPWDMSSATSTLSSVIVQQNENTDKPKVIAAFGDSIMQQGAWTTPFTLRLYQKYFGEVSFCNLGIGGNRLLHSSPSAMKGIYGRAGIERYVYDLLPIDGLTHVIFCLGTNDLGLPGKDGTPNSELISLNKYIDSVSSIIEKLKLRDIKIYGATLLPREISGVYSKEREEIRLEINEWIKSKAMFDHVLDFSSVVLDETDGLGMKKEYALPDGLHPSVLGGKVIADSIDLSLFE